MSPQALHQRGYNEQGWPLADCGRSMPPIAPLADVQQTRHACQHQCQIDEPGETEPRGVLYRPCPFLQQALGQTKTMHIADLPRLVAEVVRGTPEREKVEGLRSPSESVHSFTQTCYGLKAPRLRGDNAFFARTHLSILATLLRKAADFIQEMTRLARRLKEGQTDPLIPPDLSPRQRQLTDWLWSLIYDDS